MKPATDEQIAGWRVLMDSDPLYYRWTAQNICALVARIEQDNALLDRAKPFLEELKSIYRERGFGLDPDGLIAAIAEIEATLDAGTALAETGGEG